MGGAYVAKPADPVSRPGAPPGSPGIPDTGVPGDPGTWNPTWPYPGDVPTPQDPGREDPFFPAPFPPGYETDYSIVTTATAEIAPDGTASCTSSVRDYDDYATNEPSAITWTAIVYDVEIEGYVVVGLKFDGEEDFASSIEEDAVWGTFWGTTPDIIFDLTSDDDGDTVILQASCQLMNSEGILEAITDTSEILVAATASFSAPIEYTDTGPFWVVSLVISFGVFDYDGDENVQCEWSRGSHVPTVKEVNGVEEDYPYTIPALNGYITATIDDDGIVASINYASIPDDKYLFVNINQGEFGATISTPLTFIIGEDTYNRTLIDTEGPETWLRIWNDGTVVVVNP